LQHEILATEKVLVEGLRFDLLVELPYFYLLKYIRQLQGYVLYMKMSAMCVCRHLDKVRLCSKLL